MWFLRGVELIGIVHYRSIGILKVDFIHGNIEDCHSLLVRFQFAEILIFFPFILYCYFDLVIYLSLFREASCCSLCLIAGLGQKVRKTMGSRSCAACVKGKIRIEENLPDVVMLSLAKGELTNSDENS